MHSDEKEVAAVCSGKLSKHDERRMMSKLRNIGLQMRNKERGHSIDSDDYEKNKSTSSNTGVEICDICHGVFSRQQFHRHKNKCQPFPKIEIDTGEEIRRERQGPIPLRLS